MEERELYSELFGRIVRFEAELSALKTGVLDLMRQGLPTRDLPGRPVRNSPEPAREGQAHDDPVAEIARLIEQQP